MTQQFTYSELREYIRDNIESVTLKDALFDIELECLNPDTLSEDFQLAACLYEALHRRGEEVWQRSQERAA